jgi:hypothetical protein
MTLFIVYLDDAVADFILREWGAAASRLHISGLRICEQSYLMTAGALRSKFGLKGRIKRAMRDREALKLVRTYIEFFAL